MKINPAPLLLIMVLIALGALFYTINRSLTTTETTIMFVTSVDYDVFRQATRVYSTDQHYKVFSGLHYEIVPLNTYKFTYKRGVAWSHLISWEIVPSSGEKTQ